MHYSRSRWLPSTVLALVVVPLVSPLPNAMDVLPESIQCTLCRTAKLIGPISDCQCDFETVDTATHQYFHPLLSELQSTDYFHHFKVNLDKPCPFWDDSHEVCAMKHCAVEVCEPDEVPSPWRSEDAQHELETGFTSYTPFYDLPDDDVSAQAPDCSRNTSLLQDVQRLGGSGGVDAWVEGLSPDLWIVQDQEDESMVYVDLLENPERYTGYSGESARRVWQAIHQENCFDTTSGQCFEKRVFFRLLSGLQASISTHIAKEYYFGGHYGEGGQWGINTALFVERVGSHPDRLDNLYFLYLFMLRALAKAGPHLENFPFDSGNALADVRTRSLVRALVHPDHPLLEASDEAQSCQSGFDESKLFQETDANHPYMVELSDLEQHLAQPTKEELRLEFQTRFRNISRIMDCVGCEKCRLWGKLQILGLGTALKILMSKSDELDLQRNEVIAFINTLGQISKSVKSVQDWRQHELTDAILLLLRKALIGLIAFAVILRLLSATRRSTSSPKMP